MWYLRNRMPADNRIRIKSNKYFPLLRNAVQPASKRAAVQQIRIACITSPRSARRTGPIIRERNTHSFATGRVVPLPRQGKR